MRTWMRVMASGLVAGALAGLASCESDDEEAVADEADGTISVTNEVVTGGQTNEVSSNSQTNGVPSTNTLPSITPVIPPIDPVAILKPDLKVTDLAPVAAQLFGWNVKVSVKNLGSVNSSAFDIKLYRDGALKDTLNVPGLIAGAQATLTFPNYNFGCPDNAPRFTLRAVADASGKINESDENNNAYQESWNCPPP